MEGRRRYVSALIFVQLFQGLLGSYDMQVTPKYIVVNPGEKVSFMCKLNDPLDSCHFTVGKSKYALKPNKSKDGIKYSGGGLQNGECGLLIDRVEEKHNGNITCSMSLDTTDPTEQEGHMRLVVAISPQKPELEVNLGTENNANTYRESDQLFAKCTVRDGRPAANLTWYMGDDLITDGLRMPVETCVEKRELCTIQQNLTRTLQANDDKKILKCVASHHSLRESLVAEYHINVNYPPKPSAKPIEIFELVEGATGRVPITIEANPKPQIIWSVSGDNIYEGQPHGRYNVEYTTMKAPGVYESALLINSLTKEDVEKEYRVTAHNTLGEEKYTVIISTSPEPRVLEMGAGLIITIVVAVLIILIIIGVVLFARAKGKWCFAVGDAEKRVASPSEGTENPAVNHHASSEYISNSPDLKKEKPKEDTPV